MGAVSKVRGGNLKSCQRTTQGMYALYSVVFFSCRLPNYHFGTMFVRRRSILVHFLASSPGFLRDRPNGKIRPCVSHNHAVQTGSLAKRRLDPFHTLPSIFPSSSTTPVHAMYFQNSRDMMARLGFDVLDRLEAMQERGVRSIDVDECAPALPAALRVWEDSNYPYRYPFKFVVHFLPGDVHVLGILIFPHV